MSEVRPAPRKDAPAADVDRQPAKQERPDAGEGRAQSKDAPGNGHEKVPAKEQSPASRVLGDILGGPVTAKPLPSLSCKHEVTFQKLDVSAQATQVRITPYSGGAQMLGATAAPGWVLNSSAAAMVFKPQAGGVIPVGSHQGFSLTIRGNNAGQQWVLVEWLKGNGAVICGQPLFVPCSNRLTRFGQTAAPVPPPVYTGQTCSCLNAYTGAGEEGSADVLDADIEVTLGEIVPAGFLKFKVPYTLELDPIGLAITKVWQVVGYDENELAVVLPLQPTSDSFNPLTGQGVAIFTLTGGGEFDVSLAVSTPKNCHPENSRETTADEDSAGYRSDEVASVIEATGDEDPCTPLKYTFEDVSFPPGLNPQWTVQQAGSATVTSIALDAEGAYTYAFPTANVAYSVCLNATDPTTGLPRNPVCMQITPVPPTGNIDVKFKWKDYDSCPLKNFKVTFKNKTKNVDCPVEWKWDFGDGSSSTDKDPTHTYVNPGTYNVTLTVNGGASLTKTITVAHWEPTIAPPVDCGDGSVLWTTSDGLTVLDRKWTPSGGDYSIVRRRFKKLRVCYSAPGTYNMTLWARNSDGGKCSTSTKITINSIVRACRRDKVTEIDTFNVGNTQYRMKSTFKYSGGFRRIYVKTKLQFKPGLIWRRKKADSITAYFSGQVFTKQGTCQAAVLHTISNTGNSRTKRAKVSRSLMHGGGVFRVKKDGLVSVHTVTVGGQNITRTMKLWAEDCGCNWKQ